MNRSGKLILLWCSLCCAAAAGAPLTQVELFGSGHPQTFNFRVMAGIDRYPSYKAWKRDAAQFGGIIGKVLNEEYNPLVPNREAGAYPHDFFNRFKAEFPEKLVFLHYNGRARFPGDTLAPISKYFAGHWLYHEGSKTQSAIPAETGLTTIPVEDISRFRLDAGQRLKHILLNDDLVIVRLDADGQPDWHHAEQVVLVDQDENASTITVRRAQYHTEPLSFSAGQAYIAAHVIEGPWGGTDPRLMWFYNYSLDSPRDAEGRRCIDVMVEEITGFFESGGLLENFDGLEFDVQFSEIWRNWDLSRGVDSNGDLVPDGGIDLTTGENRYGQGMAEFQQMLRSRMGPEKLIMADNFMSGHMRGFQLYNGVEIEEFYKRDALEWSSHLNRNRFWRENTHAPSFNFAKISPANTSENRIQLACMLFTDYAAALSLRSMLGAQQMDELVNGRARNITGWLGQPRGEMIQLAKAQPNVLATLDTSDLLVTEPETQSHRSMETGGLVIKGASSATRNMEFQLADIPAAGSANVVVFLTIAAEPLPEFPAFVARRIKVDAVRADGTPIELSLRPEQNMFELGPNDYFGYVNQEPFELSFYFFDVPLLI